MDKTGIANLALSNLGEARIQNLTDNNSRARACNARLDDVITTVLRMHIWNSALQRSELTSIGTPLFGWNYTFQLPADYIRVVEVSPISRFIVEKKNILSNEKTLTLLYIEVPTDIKQEMMQKYVIALQEARAANSHDKTPEHRERSSYLDAKRGRFSVPHRTFNTPTQGYEANKYDYSVGYNIG